MRNYFDGIFRYALLVFNRVRLWRLSIDANNFRKIIEELPDPMVITDFETGRVISFNKSLIRLSGVDSTYINNRTSLSINFWESEEQRNSFVSQLTTKNICNKEIIITDYKGKRVNVILSSIIVKFGDGKKILSTLKDITASKRSENLQRVLFNISNEISKPVDIDVFFKKIHFEIKTIIDAENLYIALYHEDIDKYSFPYYVDETEEVKPDELFSLKNSLTDLVRKEKKSFFINQELQKKLIREYKNLKPYGVDSLIWMGSPLFDHNKNVMGVVTVQNYDNPKAFNINDLKLLDFVASHVGSFVKRKKAEVVIRENENKIKRFIEFSKIGICFIEFSKGIDISNMTQGEIVNSILGGKITRYNDAFRSLFSFNNLKTSENVFHVFSKGIRNTWNLFESFVVNGCALNNELIEISVSEEKKYSSTNILGHVNNGILKEIWVTFTDITNRLEVESELERAKNKAEASDKVKSAFLATMSHELRTPLNSIIGFSDLISKESSLADVHKYNEIINSSGNHLLNIVEDLFDVTLIEAGEMRIDKVEVDIHKLLNEIYQIVKDLQARLQKNNIEIEFVFPNKIENCIVKTDPYRIKQILINLIKNALKFTDNGEVQFGYVKEDSKEVNALKFYVRDTGIGIKEEDRKLVFESFKQVENSNTRLYGGTGIGLSISKKLVNLLDGEIWVESEINKGSTFFFTIPYEVSELRYSDNLINNKETSDVSVNLSGKVILIVEDNESNYELLKTILEKENYQTLWADNGKNAVEICENNGDIELVLMDINLPLMDGYKATRLIKKNKPELPVIAQTAAAVSGDLERALEAGCDDYISKPIKRDLLFKKIGSLLCN